MPSPACTETAASRQLHRGQVMEEVTNGSQPSLQATSRIKEEPGEWDVSQDSAEESEEEVYFQYSTVKAEHDEDYPWTLSDLKQTKDPLLLPGEGIKQEVKEEVPTVETLFSTVARGGELLGPQDPVLLPDKNLTPDVKKEPPPVEAFETLAVEVAVATEPAAAGMTETGRKSRNTPPNMYGEVLVRRNLRKRVRTQHTGAAVEREQNEDKSAGGGEQEGSVCGTGTKDGPARRIKVEPSQKVTRSHTLHKQKPAAPARTETEWKKRKLAPNVCGEVVVTRNLRKRVTSQHAVAGKKNIARSPVGGDLESSVNGTGNKDVPTRRIVVGQGQKITRSPAGNKQKVPTAVDRMESVRKKRNTTGNRDVPASKMMVWQGQNVTGSPPALKQKVPAAVTRAELSSKKSKSAPNICNEVLLTRKLQKRLSTQHSGTAMASQKNKPRSTISGERKGNVGGTGNRDGPARRIMVGQGQKGTGSPTVHKQKVTGSTTTQNMSVTGSTAARKQTVTRVACSECAEVFDTEARMKRHALLHTGKKLFECAECDFRTARQESISRHVKVHTVVKHDSCSQQEDRYASRNALVNRMRGLAEENCYECAKCDYCTAKRSGLSRPIRSHTGVKPYACSECDFHCAWSGILVRHIRSHTGVKPYICSECDYHSVRRSNLARHLLVHTGEKPYACLKCGFRSAQSGSLARHIRTHTGIKPYVCSECDYYSVRRSNLARHILVHTGEKPYACLTCGFRSAQSGSLARHIRTHTGIKPYACSECDYHSAQKSTLARHIRVHTGVKPYTCSKCDFRSAQSNSLAIHLRVHTGTKPFACSECDYRSVNHSNLARHLRIHTIDL